MKRYTIPHTSLSVSCLAYGGFTSLGGWNADPPTDDAIEKATRLLNAADDNGINFFDLADFASLGKAEQIFGEALKQSPGLRDRIVIQSKCAARVPEGWAPSRAVRLDLSREYIVEAVEGSLKRLSTDRLDVLLLHAPDPLAEPEEVARAFDELHRAGKVRYFGVSNYGVGDLKLLRQHVRQPLVANQIHLGLAHYTPILNTAPTGFNGVVDYCRLHGIQVQAYSPLRGGILEPPEGATPKLECMTELLTAIARKHFSDPSAVALAWLLRHPAGIVPVIGATSVENLKKNCQADCVNLSREEWYDLYNAAVATTPVG